VNLRFAELFLRIFRKYELFSFYRSRIGQTRVKVFTLTLQREHCGENHADISLAVRSTRGSFSSAFSQQRFALPNACETLRRCA